MNVADDFKQGGHMSGLGAYYITDAAGRTRVVSEPIGGREWPGVHTTPGEAEPALFPGQSIAPWTQAPPSVYEFLKRAKSTEELRAICEGYRATFMPATLGQDAISVPVSSTVDKIVQSWGDSFFVVRSLLIGYDVTLSTNFTLRFFRNAGSVALSNNEFPVSAFNESGANSGGLYRLPQRWIIRPSDELDIRVRNVSGAAVALCDVHLAGYRVFVARR